PPKGLPALHSGAGPVAVRGSHGVCHSRQPRLDRRAGDVPEADPGRGLAGRLAAAAGALVLRAAAAQRLVAVRPRLRAGGRRGPGPVPLLCAAGSREARPPGQRHRRHALPALAGGLVLGPRHRAHAAPAPARRAQGPRARSSGGGSPLLHAPPLRLVLPRRPPVSGAQRRLHAPAGRLARQRRKPREQRLFAPQRRRQPGGRGRIQASCGGRIETHLVSRPEARRLGAGGRPQRVSGPRRRRFYPPHR
ncbi:hypothetical protein H632_c4727p0, partial [Helicosporidium sp. ATCC 50920]